MTTREVLNVQRTYAEDMPMSRPMFSEWELVDQKDVKDGKESYYQLMAGDPIYPATIRIGAYQKADGTRSFSARLDTFVKVTDDNDEITYLPISYTVARTTLHSYGGETGDYAALANLIIFSGFAVPLATPALTASPAVDYTISTRRKFGIPTFDLGEMDDPAEA